MYSKLKSSKLIIIMLLTAAVALAPTSAAQEGQDQKENVIEALEAMGNFESFINALKAAGLADELKKPGRLNVCAPTDNTFAVLPAGALDALIKDPEKLRGILLSGFVSGEMTSIQPSEKKVVADKGAEESSEESPVASICNAAKRSQIPAFGGATIIEYNFDGSNGVIHVLDVVLMTKR